MKKWIKGSTKLIRGLANIALDRSQICNLLDVIRTTVWRIKVLICFAVDFWQSDATVNLALDSGSDNLPQQNSLIGNKHQQVKILGKNIGHLWSIPWRQWSRNNGKWNTEWKKWNTVVRFALQAVGPPVSSTTQKYIVFSSTLLGNPFIFENSIIIDFGFEGYIQFQRDSVNLVALNCTYIDC